MDLASCYAVPQVQSGMLSHRCRYLMAFTEGIPLCETLYVNECRHCGHQTFAAVPIYTDNLLPSKKKCIKLNACYGSFNIKTCYMVAKLLINCIQCRERRKGGVVKRKV